MLLSKISSIFIRRSNNVGTFWASPTARNVIRRASNFSSSTLNSITGIAATLLSSTELLNLSKFIVDILNSDSFDPSGKNTNVPLFERLEDRITKQLAYLLSIKHNSDIYCVFNEELYDQKSKRGQKCDMVVFDLSGKELWIEGKLSWDKECTGGRWEDCSASKYIEDIDKLKDRSPEHVFGIFMLLAFRPRESQPEDSLVVKISEKIGTQPYWDKFSMPTRDHGPCICHLLLWHVK